MMSDPDSPKQKRERAKSARKHASYMKRQIEKIKTERKVTKLVEKQIKEELNEKVTYIRRVHS